MAYPSDSTTSTPADTDLIPGESELASLPAEGGRFVMTVDRILFRGGAETEAIYASARLRDVTSVEITRRPRESRSAWWGGLGLLAAVGVWEVSSNATVGGIAAAVVAIISIALLADYWFRPSGVILSFRTSGSAVQGLLATTAVESARQFVHEFEQVRAYYSRPGSFGPTAGYGSF